MCFCNPLWNTPKLWTFKPRSPLRPCISSANQEQSATTQRATIPKPQEKRTKASNASAQFKREENFSAYGGNI